MKVKIFTEGGSEIGLGHISRCSALYDEVSSRGIEVEMYVYGDIGRLYLLDSRNVSTVNWLSEAFLGENIRRTDYCIIDSYLATEDLLQLISDSSERALFIDDNARICYPEGIVVNPSLSPYHLNYPSDRNNVYLLGADYIILRSPFRNAYRSVINETVKNVLITMGGADHSITPKILETICPNYPQIRFSTIVGYSFHDHSLVQDVGLDNVELFSNIGAETIKDIMQRSDFAITAAGQTIFELLATQTPFIPIQNADNQKINVDGLTKINLCQDILRHGDELLIERLDEEFRRMLKPTERERFLDFLQNKVDGLGSKRIINCFLQE